MMMMQMTFYTGWNVQFPLPFWSVSSPGAYFGSLLLVALGGFLQHLVLFCSTSFKLRKDSTATFDVLSPKGELSFGKVLLRILLTTVVSGLAYFNMLVAMTFNVGVFFALMAGMAAGYAVSVRDSRAKGSGADGILGGCH